VYGLETSYVSQSFFVLLVNILERLRSLGEKEMRDRCLPCAGRGGLRHKRPYFVLSTRHHPPHAITPFTSLLLQSTQPPIHVHVRTRRPTKGIDHTTYYTPCGATNRPFLHLPSPPFSSPRPPAPLVAPLSVAPPSASFRHCIYVEAPSSSS